MIYLPIKLCTLIVFRTDSKNAIPKKSFKISLGILMNCFLRRDVHLFFTIKNECTVNRPHTLCSTQHFITFSFYFSSHISYVIIFSHPLLLESLFAYEKYQFSHFLYWTLYKGHHSCHFPNHCAIITKWSVILASSC